MIQSDTLATIWADIDRLTCKEESKPVDTRICEVCNVFKMLTREGMTCVECGRIDSVYIDESAEWTSGVTEGGQINDPSRCVFPTNNPELFSDSWGKGTIISTKFNNNYETKRMAKINFHSSMNHRDRSLYHAYKDIDEACHTLPGCVLKDAKTLYKKFNEGKLTRGAVRLGIKANCVLYACRLAGTPRTTKEIAEMFGIQCKDISRTTQIFTETVDKDETDKNYVTKPFNVMQRLLNNFEITREERLKCGKICSDLDECVELMSKSPNSVASAIIFIVLKGKVSKTYVCEKCSVSVPTLNKIEVIIKRHLEVKV